MSQHFPITYSFSDTNKKVELDLSSYATKSKIHAATGADTAIFVKKTDLNYLNIEVNKVDIAKLQTVPSDLKKLRDFVEHGLIKTFYDKLNLKDTETKVPNTNTLVNKSQCNTEK